MPDLITLGRKAAASTRPYNSPVQKIDDQFTLSRLKRDMATMLPRTAFTDLMVASPARELDDRTGSGPAQNEELGGQDGIDGIGGVERLRPSSSQPVTRGGCGRTADRRFFSARWP